MKTIILGAGFTGLAAGIKTGSPIYEATDKSGGICTDYDLKGFKFSNGGPHWIFGKDKGLEYIKTLVEVKEYERKAGVYFNHTFPYPIQYFAKQETEISIFSMKHSLSSFGKELGNLFFYPFNDKYTVGLMNDIIPQDEYKTPSQGTGWVSTFCDPVNGLSDLVNKMSSKCTIKYNHKATSIDVDKKEVNFENGNSVSYDRLISTIPLNKCMELCGQSVNLPYTSVLVVNIGAEPGMNLPKEHWLYIPFCKSGFHRVAFYTNVDPSKAPEGKVGLSVELAYRGECPKYKCKEIIEELHSWGWIKGDIIWKSDIVECAYTWQYNREDVPNALAWLKERDIISIGRYGTWRFCGLTESIMMGFSV